MAAKWSDITSYSRREPEPRIARTWELRSGSMRVVVTRLVGQSGWWTSCASVGLGGSFEELRCAELADAQQEALDLVQERLLELVRAFEAATDRQLSEGMAPA